MCGKCIAASEANKGKNIKVLGSIFDGRQEEIEQSIELAGGAPVDMEIMALINSPYVIGYLIASHENLPLGHILAVHEDLARGLSDGLDLRRTRLVSGMSSETTKH